MHPQTHDSEKHGEERQTYSVAAMKAVQMAATMKSDHVLKNANRRLQPLASSWCSSRAFSVVDMVKVLCAAV